MNKMNNDEQDECVLNNIIFKAKEIQKVNFKKENKFWIQKQSHE